MFGGLPTEDLHIPLVLIGIPLEHLNMSMRIFTTLFIILSITGFTAEVMEVSPIALITELPGQTFGMGLRSCSFIRFPVLKPIRIL